MDKRMQRMALMLALSAALAGCGAGGESGPGPLATGTGAATIGAVGGVVTGENGAEVRFPAKALATDVTVRIAKDGTGAPPLPPVATSAGAVYMITPHGGALNAHAEVAIPIERTAIGANEQLLLVTAQPGDTQWTVLSGATYSNGVLRAPVMHFSYFRAIVLTPQLTMPSLVTTVGHDPAWWTAPFDRSNNIGGAGIGRFAADFEFNENSSMQQHYAYLQATLTPAPVRATVAGVSSSSRSCLPTSYGNNGASWRFLRNGSESLTPTWDAPPAGSRASDSTATWLGRLLFNAEQHNGRMRIDVTVATDCNLLLEAVPLAFNLNLISLKRGTRLYNGVLGYPAPVTVASGDTAVLPFEEEFEGSSLSIAWEFSNDVVNWQRLPVPTQYIRDDGHSGFRDRYLYGHLYSIVIPNVQPSQAGWYRAWACSKPQPEDRPFPAVPSVCLSKTPVQLIVVTTPPTVVTPPAAQIVQVGETASFIVRYGGEISAGVQWQKRSLVEAAFGLGTWASIPGATDTVYTTPPATANDHGMLYRAVVSNSLGSAVSAAALLTVVEQLAPPVVQSQPGNANAVIGSTAVFVATVSGTAPLSYQWRRGGVNITGANTPALTISNVSPADDGLYELVVSNRAGSVTTAPARLVTLATPVALAPTIAAPPASITVAAGQAANFAVAVNGTGPYTYAWQKVGSSGPITGADGASFSIPLAAAADAGGYTVRVTNSVGSVLSVAATLTVTPATGAAVAPTITTAPVGVAALPGAAATFAVAVTGTGPFSYQWRRDGADVPGATSAVLHIAAVNAFDSGQYAVEVRNAVGAAASSAVPLIVIGSPVINAQPAATTAAAGASALFAVTATGDGLRYLWLRNGIAISGAVAASYTTPALAQGDSGALYSVLVYNGAGAVFSQAAALTVTAPVAVAAWQTPAPIETDDTGNAQAPSIAVNAAGEAVAVWMQPGGGVGINIWANRYTPAGGWGAAQRISDGQGGAQGAPAAVIDASGHATVVWQQADSIWANRYVPGTGWRTPEVIDLNSGWSGSPQIAVDASGNALAVWMESRNGRLNIEAARFIASAGAWSGTATLDSDNTGDASAPQVAVNATGNAVVAWAWAADTGGGNYVYKVWATRYLPGIGWGDAEPLDSNNTQQPNPAPQVAAGAGQNAIVVWHRRDNGIDHVKSSHYSASAGWVQSLEVDPAVVSRNARVAIDSAGNALAVWEQYVGATANVMASRYNGATWGASTLIETDNAGSAYTPQIVIDANGVGTALWSQRNAAGFTDNVWVNRYTPGSGWAGAVAIDGQPQSATQPALGVDAGGGLLAVWEQMVGSVKSLWASAYR